MDGIDQLTKVIASGEEDVLNHRLRWTHLAVAVMPSKVEKVEDLHDSAHVTGKLRLDPGQLFPPSRLSSDRHIRSLRVLLQRQIRASGRR